jgi:hypothetical protein
LEATAGHIFNVPAELQLAVLAAVRFANQASMGQKGVRFSMKTYRRAACSSVKWRSRFFMFKAE